jgi:hypothetical protein
VYVDDLFISSKSIESIHRIEQLLKSRFKEITFHFGLQHEYLGAHASYGIRSIDRRSQTGVVVQLGQATLIARSGKQKLVTKSSTEAELVACSDSLVYGIVLKNILDELGVSHRGILMHQDNLSTIALLNNSKPSSIRTKHIDIRYFFLRDRMRSKNLRIIHTPTATMTADLLTKPLQGSQFKLLRNLLMNCDRSARQPPTAN